jgi:hypothetical protein
MFLNPNIQIILFLDILFLVFLVISLFLSIDLLKNWDFSSTTVTQYKLEKRSYLVSTIIKYIFFLKLPLFLFFIYSIDQLSDIIIGAMCSAGVIDASSYGIPLLILKLVDLYLFGFWLIIHYGDLKYPDLRFTKIKFGFFIVASFLIISEIILDFLMFDSIDLNKIAVCCGSLFSNTSTSYLGILFTIDLSYYAYFFYIIFILNIIFYIKKNDYMFSIGNILFLVISIISLIMFFSTYIYELPTHHCPFCILQKEYYFIGYFLYLFLFLGTFYGIGLVVGNLVEDDKGKYYKLSLLFNTFYLLIVSYYPISYYLKNGVWL